MLWNQGGFLGQSPAQECASLHILGLRVRNANSLLRRTTAVRGGTAVCWFGRSANASGCFLIARRIIEVVQPELNLFAVQMVSRPQLFCAFIYSTWCVCTGLDFLLKLWNTRSVLLRRLCNGPLAQLVEQQTLNLWVAGSKPAWLRWIGR